MDFGITNIRQFNRIARTNNRAGSFEKNSKFQHPGLIGAPCGHLTYMSGVVSGRGHNLLRPEHRSIELDLRERYFLASCSLGLDAWPHLIKVVAQAQPPVGRVTIIPVR